MSYYVNMNFVPNVKPHEVYDFLRKEIDYHKSTMGDRISRDVENAIMRFDAPETKEEITKLYPKIYDILHQDFLFTTIYYPEYELLAFIGDVSIDKKIAFQNYTDSNYSFETYDEIDCLQDIVEKYKNMSEEQILKKYNEFYDEDLDEPLSVDYYRKSLCYREIRERLEVEKYIYQIEDFIKNHWFLKIDAIETLDDSCKFRRIVRKSIKDWYDKNPEWI